MLDHSVGPERLSKILGLEHSLRTAKKKTTNEHRLSAYLINQWVIKSERSERPNAVTFADQFEDSTVQDNIKTFW